MCIEAKIHIFRKTFSLHDIPPGTYVPLIDFVSNQTLIIACNPEDDGGTLSIFDEGSVGFSREDGIRVDSSGLIKTIDIAEGGRHFDYIGLTPLAPLIIGQLLLKHKS